MSPSGFAEVVRFGSVPENVGDSIMLKVILPERPPAPLRRATLSVGNRTWSLNRLEINLSLRGTATHKIIQYYGAGDVAEQILSAMTQPSDIVVTATVVASTVATEPPKVSPPDQDRIGPAPPAGIFRGRAVPESSSSRPLASSDVKAARTYAARRDPPEPVLRIESRSTQLSNVIQSFRACYAGDNQ